MVKGSPHLVYINVSPIEYGHVLLVPRVLDCLPQVRRRPPKHTHTHHPGDVHATDYDSIQVCMPFTSVLSDTQYSASSATCTLHCEQRNLHLTGVRKSTRC